MANTLDNSILGAGGEKWEEWPQASNFLDNTVGILRDLVKRYNALFKGTDTPLYTRKDLRGMDTIDVTAYAKWPESEPARILKVEAFGMAQIQASKELGFYTSIPCFKEGVVKITPKRYFYFKVHEVDTENQRIVVTLYDYGFWESSGWTLNACGKFTLHPPTGGKDVDTRMLNEKQKELYRQMLQEGDMSRFAAADIIGAMLQHEIYSADEFVAGLTAEENTVWQAYLSQLKDHEKKLNDRGLDSFNALIVIFTQCISRANVMLYMGRPSRPKPLPDAGEKRLSAKAAGTEAAQGTDAQKTQRRVRTVGGLSFTSKSVPKVPSEKTVRHWHTAQWTQVGHPRKYKNGKVVYILPQTKHRKALQHTGSKDSTVIPTTVKLKKEGTENGSK